MPAETNRFLVWSDVCCCDGLISAKIILVLALRRWVLARHGDIPYANLTANKEYHLEILFSLDVKRWLYLMYYRINLVHKAVTNRHYG